MHYSPAELANGKLDFLHPYLAELGINRQAVTDFQIGFLPEKGDIMGGRIIIPIRDVDGSTVAYAGRWPGLPPSGVPKFLFSVGFNKELELFNIDRAARQRPDRPLLIVNGFFNVIKLHQRGYSKVVALMGNSMSIVQEELIYQESSRHSQVIVMMDENEAGRICREDIASRLSKFCFVKVHVFDKPDAEPNLFTTRELEEILGFAL
jgi:DNA primase